MDYESRNSRGSGSKDPLEFHLKYMKTALALARRALEREEVPVGAVVVWHDRVIGRGWNQTIFRTDPCAHAEIVALRQAARRMGNYRLTSATLYCTLEPCAMCAGALVHGRLRTLVYGARDPKAGAVDSHLSLLGASFLNHRIEVISGVLQEDAGKLLREFFRQKRLRARTQ